MLPNELLFSERKGVFAVMQPLLPKAGILGKAAHPCPPYLHLQDTSAGSPELEAASLVFETKSEHERISWTYLSYMEAQQVGQLQVLRYYSVWQMHKVACANGQSVHVREGFCVFVWFSHFTFCWIRTQLKCRKAVWETFVEWNTITTLREIKSWLNFPKYPHTWQSQIICCVYYVQQRELHVRIYLCAALWWESNYDILVLLYQGSFSRWIFLWHKVTVRVWVADYSSKDVRLNGYVSVYAAAHSGCTVI